MIQSPCVPHMDFWQDVFWELPTMNLIPRRVPGPVWIRNMGYKQKRLHPPHCAAFLT